MEGILFVQQTGGFFAEHGTANGQSHGTSFLYEKIIFLEPVPSLAIKRHCGKGKLLYI